MNKQEKEILERYESALIKYKAAKKEYDELSKAKEIEKLKKKYVGKYFKSKEYDCYYFIKEIPNTSNAICDCITIDENYSRIDGNYNEYFCVLNIKKSNKLEFTNALNVAIDRMFNLKKLMI